MLPVPGTALLPQGRTGAMGHAPQGQLRRWRWRRWPGGAGWGLVAPPLVSGPGACTAVAGLCRSVVETEQPVRRNKVLCSLVTDF